MINELLRKLCTGKQVIELRKGFLNLSVFGVENLRERQ